MSKTVLVFDCSGTISVNTPLLKNLVTNLCDDYKNVNVQTIPLLGTIAPVPNVCAIVISGSSTVPLSSKKSD